VKAPTGAKLTALASRIASRVGRFLERKGLLERDAENPCLSELALGDEPMEALLAHSITYRIALGPRAGRKVFTLQSLPVRDESCSAVAGRPAVSEAHLSLTPGGLVRDALKTPYSDGTTHVLFEQLDFIARLAALVPKPRVNLIRLPRTVRTPQRPPGAGDEVRAGPRRKTPPEDNTPAERRASTTWAQRLKRVFKIDIETCPACGGAMGIIACLENPVVIEKILDHLEANAAAGQASRLPLCRAPPPRPWG
jgi:hypothetical protein